MLIGADLLNLDQLEGIGRPFFDSAAPAPSTESFVTRMMAVLLAGLTGSGRRRRARGASRTRVVKQEPSFYIGASISKIPDPPHCGGGVTALLIHFRHWWSEANPSQLSSNSSRPDSR